MYPTDIYHWQDTTGRTPELGTAIIVAPPPAHRRAPTCCPPPDTIFPTPIPPSATPTRALVAFPCLAHTICITRTHGGELASHAHAFLANTKHASKGVCGSRLHMLTAPLCARQPLGCAHPAVAGCASLPIGWRPPQYCLCRCKLLGRFPNKASRVARPAGVTRYALDERRRMQSTAGLGSVQHTQSGTSLSPQWRQ